MTNGGVRRHGYEQSVNQEKADGEVKLIQESGQKRKSGHNNLNTNTNKNMIQRDQCISARGDRGRHK